MPRNQKTVDFTRNPYRGILTEVAKELDTTRVSVFQRYYRNSPKIVEMVQSKIRERRRMVGGDSVEVNQ